MQSHHRPQPRAIGTCPIPKAPETNARLTELFWINTTEGLNPDCRFVICHTLFSHQSFNNGFPVLTLDRFGHPNVIGVVKENSISKHPVFNHSIRTCDYKLLDSQLLSTFQRIV